MIWCIPCLMEKVVISLRLHINRSFWRGGISWHTNKTKGVTDQKHWGQDTEILFWQVKRIVYRKNPQFLYNLQNKIGNKKKQWWQKFLISVQGWALLGVLAGMGWGQSCAHISNWKGGGFTSPSGLCSCLFITLGNEKVQVYCMSTMQKRSGNLYSRTLT